jgi:hypothetical protein
MKPARARSERHTYGADAANDRTEPTHDDRETGHDDTKAA